MRDICFGIGAFLFFFCSLAVGSGVATPGAWAQVGQGPVKPLDDDRVHRGVVTCQGSQCHSRGAPTGPRVRQNEIVTWGDRTRVAGAHARAYRVLSTPVSASIARNLGLGDPQKAPECLSCHAHNVAEDQRGDRFDLTEGVTCEACHGGAGDWLATHYISGTTHADNLANGLYPTSDVAARASLCLDCHFGSDREDQFVTHRIMGAGHPRISFELDLFTALQQHHDEDADYRARKAVLGGIKTWAVGQAMALERSATLFADDKYGQDGLFPEFYFFDCHACHQPISNDPKSVAGWRPNPGRPLGPGVPVFDDANAIMLKAAIAEVLPADAERFEAATAALHRATLRGRPQAVEASARLAAFGGELSRSFQAAAFAAPEGKSILARILASALGQQYTNYASGEQAVIAVDTFLNAMIAEQMITGADYDGLRPALDAAYAAVQSPTDYDQQALRGALRQIAARVAAF